MNSTLHEIREANNAGADPPYAATLVIYNFPDRDCSAEASAGELLIAEDGVNRYKTEYIDPIAELVQEFSDIRTVFVYGKQEQDLVAMSYYCRRLEAHALICRA